jgi:hypothetical protein
MKPVRLIAVAFLVVGLLPGCLAPPSIVHPGPEAYQQARAQKFDPYPEPEIGPNTGGLRPADYQSPPAEVLRVQPRDPCAPGY